MESPKMKYEDNDYDCLSDDEAFEEDKVVEIDNFDDMKLKKKVLRGIYAYGFEKPSAIQSKAIPVVMSGKDIIGQAQSGTGKTGTFVIGMLQRIDCRKLELQAIIMAPTRELADQIKRVTDNIGSYSKVKTCLCVGGTDTRENIKELRAGVHVVIGTPGRIQHMVNTKALVGKYVKMFILDEADQMLSTDFKFQVRDIVDIIPRDSQICIFSATLSHDVLDITKKFMNHPTKILVKNELLTLEGIKQFFIALKKEQWKLGTLIDLYEKINVSQSIIYVNTKQKADYVVKQLREKDFTVACIHGDQSDRKKIMEEFRTGKSRVLVTTDLLARGIDIQQVSIVINYDLPNDIASYLHRIGRSGRFGRKGVAINFVCDSDVTQFRSIESYYNTQIDEMPMNFADFLES
jgi:translation initiation factor 4A